MMGILYLVSLIGSFSIGYSALRIGFPEIQNEELNKKIGMGYLLGLIIFLPSILAIFLDLELFFFLFAIGMYGFLSTIMFIVRIYYNKEDTVELIDTKQTPIIPKKALTPEEKESENIQEGIDFSNQNTNDHTKDDFDYSNYKLQKAKELNVEDKIKKANHSTTGKNENGLFIKDSTIQNKEHQRQIFKEKQPNVINEIRQKTIGKEEKTKQTLSEKDKIISNLKKLTKKNREKSLNKKKDKNIDLDDDLETLTEIDEEF